MELISLAFGIGITCGWWFTNELWPINNLIAFCIMTMAIKLVKFTSMQWAGGFMFFLLAIEIIATTVINILNNQSYTSFFIR